jgi:hypothetical protein
MAPRCRHSVDFLKATLPRLSDYAVQAIAIDYQGELTILIARHVTDVTHPKGSL